MLSKKAFQFIELELEALKYPDLIPDYWHYPGLLEGSRKVGGVKRDINDTADIYGVIQFKEGLI